MQNRANYPQYIQRLLSSSARARCSPSRLIACRAFSARRPPTTCCGSARTTLSWMPLSRTARLIASLRPLPLLPRLLSPPPLPRVALVPPALAVARAFAALRVRLVCACWRRSPFSECCAVDLLLKQHALCTSPSLSIRTTAARPTPVTVTVAAGKNTPQRGLNATCCGSTIATRTRKQASPALAPEALAVSVQRCATEPTASKPPCRRSERHTDTTTERSGVSREGEGGLKPRQRSNKQ
jgi:hypothetical protein